MSVDGKIATVGGDSKLSCPEDLRRLHRLRSQVDAVMVGVGTVLSDDPSLTVRLVRGRNPIRVVVDSTGSTPLTSKVLDGSAPTIIAASEKIKKERILEFEKRGAKVVVVGRSRVDLKKLLNKLHQMGVRKLLLEGGSTLNWSMIKDGLVDELRISISPVVLGGEKAKTLVGGEGFKKISEAFKVKLVKVNKIGRDLLLIYRKC